MMKWGADGHAVRQIFWAWATRQEGKLIMYSVGDRKPVVQLVTKLVFCFLYTSDAADDC